MSLSDLPPLSPSAGIDEIREYLMQMDQWRRAREPVAAGIEDQKFVTRDALLDGSLSIVVNTITVGGGSGSSGPSGDLSPPTTITGLTASSAIYHHIVEWDAPTYTAGGGNAYTEVYRAIYSGTGPLPTFANAVLVFAATGPLNIVAIPAQPGEQAHFWVGAVTANGVRQVDGAGPTGGTNGVQTTTGQDVEYLLGVLEGQITASQLYADLATPIGRITSNADDAAADVLLNAVATHEETMARVAAVLAEAQDRGAAIEQTTLILTAADSSLAQAITVLAATVNNTTTGVLATAAALDLIETLVYDGTNGMTAVASRTLALETTVNDGAAGVVATAAALDVVETLVNHGTQGNVALASRTTTLETAVNSPTSLNNPTYAALQVTASVLASDIGDLEGQYTVKIDLNGYVTGYGLASTATGATPTSLFLVRADQFAVVPPTDYTQSSPPSSPSLNQRWYDTDDSTVRRWNGSAWVAFNTLPFVVQASPTTEGGVAIDAGVYMDAAYILNLTAQYAKFASLVADDITAADIATAQLTAGSLRVGGYIQSTNYVTGISGWRITAAGVLEAQDAILRGTIYASAGTIGGIVITSSALQSTNFDGSFDSAGEIVDTGTVGWGISKAGKLVLDVAHTRDSKSMAAQDTVSVYDGAAVSSVDFEQPFAQHVGNGFAVKAGCDGYINLYLNTSSARVLEIGYHILARETTTLDECYGPSGTHTVHCGGGVAWSASSSYRYALPISAQWLFGGSYWTETGAMRPGTAGVPASPMQVENFLGAGTWEIMLVLNVTCYSPGTATASAVIEDARLYLGGWKHDLPGSIAFDEPSPPGWA